MAVVNTVSCPESLVSKQSHVDVAQFCIGFSTLNLILILFLPQGWCKTFKKLNIFNNDFPLIVTSQTKRMRKTGPQLFWQNPVTIKCNLLRKRKRPQHRTICTLCSALHEVTLWCLVVNQHDMFTVGSVHLIKKAWCASLGSKKCMPFFSAFLTHLQSKAV